MAWAWCPNGWQPVQTQITPTKQKRKKNKMKVTNINPEFNGVSDPFRIILVDTTEALLHPVLLTPAVTLCPEETAVYSIQIDIQDHQTNPLPTEYKVFGHVYCCSRESEGESEETVQLLAKVEYGKREEDHDIILLRITNPTEDKYICAYTIVAQ